MKLNDLAPHAANVDAAAPITSTVAHEVFQRLGAITRQPAVRRTLPLIGGLASLGAVALAWAMLSPADRKSVV